jgi:hypothetical protein
MNSNKRRTLLLSALCLPTAYWLSRVETFPLAAPATFGAHQAIRNLMQTAFSHSSHERVRLG